MRTIQEVMSKSVEVVHSNATLAEVARKMKNRGVGVLPVCDKERLLGIITDRDIVTRAIAENKDLNRTKVSEIMTRDTHSCFMDQTVEEAAALMQKHQIRRLIVLDRNHELAGILSLVDMAGETSHAHLVGKTLRETATPKNRLLEAQPIRSFLRERPALFALGTSAIAIVGILFFSRKPSQFKLPLPLKKVVPLSREREGILGKTRAVREA